LALDGDEWSTVCPQLSYPWERTPEAIEYETGWAVESLWMFWRKEKSLTPAGFEP